MKHLRQFNEYFSLSDVDPNDDLVKEMLKNKNLIKALTFKMNGPHAEKTYKFEYKKYFVYVSKESDIVTVKEHDSKDNKEHAIKTKLSRELYDVVEKIYNENEK